MSFVEIKPSRQRQLAGRAKTAARPPEPPTALRRALQAVLRPLVRLLVEQGVPFYQLAELLKGVYVDVALHDFPLEGKDSTDSRVTLLTGVHRKDVKRLRATRTAVDEAPKSVSLGALLVARWTGTAAYLDAEGRPKPLARRADRGASFEKLVASVSTDIRPRAVLDEWLRLGVAHLDAEDRVCLNAEAFVPTKGFEEKAYSFGRNLHDHVAAAAHNLAGKKPAFLERSVYSPGLSKESVAELAKLAARAGMQALQAVNRRALELERRDAADEGASQRMNFGVYFYDVDTNAEARADEDGSE
jgi:hypothetical protein